jgi:hypothetical protein
MEATKPKGEKVQATLSSETFRRVKALAKAKNISDSEVMNYIAQSWMVDNFDKEYGFWKKKIKEQS